MKLRYWQTECASSAISLYKSKSKHFFCFATPGAGKTIMAAHVAKLLIKEGLIDLVLCFSPSKAVCDSFERTFSTYLNQKFDGAIGAVGCSLTYQSMAFLKPRFWSILKTHRALIVFDEIHHCEGAEFIDSNAWGYEILKNVQNQANYTLSLSGTPWRSNGSPITLGRYNSRRQKISCDYVYSINHAIKDNVCRKPKVVLVDNSNISVTNQDGEFSYCGLQDFLKDPAHSYQSVLNNEIALKTILSKANKKLTEIRKENRDAGGLIVAASVSHAKQISLVLTNLGERPALVSYQESNSNNIIDQFRNCNSKWIVSIGMISEGTDIPRLQVCCHLSKIKTELYFRQVLGRILRRTGSENQDAWLYTFAEEKLSLFASRLQEEIPFLNVVKNENVNLRINDTSQTESSSSKTSKSGINPSFTNPYDNTLGEITDNSLSFREDNHSTLCFLGDFKEQVIESYNSPF